MEIDHALQVRSFLRTGWGHIFSKTYLVWIIVIFLQISLCTAIILKKFKAIKGTCPIFKILLMEYGISLFLHFLTAALLIGFDVFLYFAPFNNTIGDLIDTYPALFIFTVVIVCVCFRISRKLNLRFIAPRLADSIEKKSRLIKGLSALSTPFIFLLPVEIVAIVAFWILGINRFWV